MRAAAPARPMQGEHPSGSGEFARLLDAREGAHDDEHYEVRMTADGRHEREGGILHGGLQMTLLDMAMAGAVGRTLAPDERTASVVINTEFLRPATRGELVARGRLVRRGATMAFPAGELRDATGRLVATATGVWAIRKA